jgi:hypothetical protein
MVRRETARVRVILGHTLLLVSAAGGGVTMHACAGGSSHAGATDAAASGDATFSGADAESRGDAGADVDAGYPWAPGCEPAPPVPYDAGADAPACELRTTLPCGLPPFVTAIDPFECQLDLASCLQICTGAAYPFLECGVSNGFGCDYDAEAFVAPDGAPIVIQCDKCTISGRRPAGLARARIRAQSALAAFLASAAHLEAASVVAFEQLAADLARLGAPASLVQAARRSAADEVRHAQTMARLARRRGAEPPPVRVVRRSRASLATLATDNAVEGRVRETYGALIAAWQARHASDADVAHAMARIAVDETRHAGLAWAIARWAEPRLDKASREVARASARRAVGALRRRAGAAIDPGLALAAGLPSPREAVALVDRLDAVLWAPALS